METVVFVPELSGARGGDNGRNVRDGRRRKHLRLDEHAGTQRSARHAQPVAGARWPHGRGGFSKEPEAPRAARSRPSLHLRRRPTPGARATRARRRRQASVARRLAFLETASRERYRHGERAAARFARALRGPGACCPRGHGRRLPCKRLGPGSRRGREDAGRPLRGGRRLPRALHSRGADRRLPLPPQRRDDLRRRRA